MLFIIDHLRTRQLNLVHVQDGHFSVEEPTGFSLDVVYVFWNS